ncbi:ferredoxin--NADP reductase [Plasmodium malariae]|uniref:ferredoxin--NADP(+) reductase n=1 Tax=Plasmodium malariae TaxID=5858 RepID=A0A1A8WXI9_PLAMA|nr:ferredoxin--NADP reductase [Plasmodium malariae]
MNFYLVLILAAIIAGAFSNEKNRQNYSRIIKKRNSENRMIKLVLFLYRNTVHKKKKKKFKNWNSKENNICSYIYTVKNPLRCKVVDKVKLVRKNALHDVYNLEINHNGMLQYIEGQSCGIIPYYNQLDELKDKILNEQNCNDSSVNGQNCSDNNVHANTKEGGNIKRKNCARLYSISSSNSQNLSVAIRIHKYVDETDGIKQLKYGYCSEFIENIKKNDNIYLTGPHGNFNLPNDVVEKNVNLILVATGTGISPYISFLKKILGCENTNMNKSSNYNGLIYLFYGVYNEDSILYISELEHFKKVYPHNLHITYIFSVNKNKDGCSFHVQDEIFKRKEEFLHLFNYYKCELYICGHKSIKNKILDILKNDQELDREKRKRVHVEVY